MTGRRSRRAFENSLGWLDSADERGRARRSPGSRTLGLRGRKEQTASHDDVGARFVPENTGFALVQSETADVFALRLVHTGALVAYQMRPNPDIPKDWNIITFPIDPRYTKQGTLDGKVGLEPTTTTRTRCGYSSDQQLLQADRGLRAQEPDHARGAAAAHAFDQFDAGAGRRGGQSRPTRGRR